MKQGIIVKKSQKYAVVLSNDTKFEKIQLKPEMTTGQKIFYFEGDVVNMTKGKMIRVSALVASLLVLVMVMSILKLSPIDDVYAKTYAVVTVDINPSIEIDIDFDNKVMEVTALNDDANNVISKDMVGKTLDEVMDLILANAKAQGYLVDAGNILISSVILHETEEEVKVVVEDVADEETKTTVDTSDIEDTVSVVVTEDQDELEDIIEAFIQKKIEQYNFLYVKGTEEALRASKSQGLSLGKFEMLKFIDEDITQEEIKAMKVAEIAERKEIKEQAKLDKHLEIFEKTDEDSTQDQLESEEKVTFEEDVEVVSEDESLEDEDTTEDDKVQGKGNQESKENSGNGQNIDKDNNKDKDKNIEKDTEKVTKPNESSQQEVDDEDSIDSHDPDIDNDDDEDDEVDEQNNDDKTKDNNANDKSEDVRNNEEKDKDSSSENGNGKSKGE